MHSSGNVFLCLFDMFLEYPAILRPYNIAWYNFTTELKDTYVTLVLVTSLVSCLLMFPNKKMSLGDLRVPNQNLRISWKENGMNLGQDRGSQRSNDTKNQTFFSTREIRGEDTQVRMTCRKPRGDLAILFFFFADSRDPWDENHHSSPPCVEYVWRSNQQKNKSKLLRHAK